MQDKDNHEEPFEMAKNPKEEGWFDGQRYIPWNKLSNRRLQTAKLHAQRKELEYLNIALFFDSLVEKADKEAERRGLTLRDYNTDFHRNQRYFKNINSGKEELNNGKKPKAREDLELDKYGKKVEDA